MDELILTIDGMSCGHCVGQVTKALSQLDGVQVKTVKVREEPRRVSVKQEALPARCAWHWGSVKV